MVNPTLFAIIKNEIPYKIQAIKAGLGERLERREAVVND